MTQTGTSSNPAGQTGTQLPLFIEMFPGASVEKSLPYLVPSGSEAKPLDTLIREALASEPSKGLSDCRGSLINEYSATAGITIGGEPANRTDPLSKYLPKAQEKTTAAGKPYRNISMRIARPQDGGSIHYFQG